MTAPTYARSDAALWHRTSRRTLVGPPGGRTFELRGTAALVWEALCEPVTLEALADDLAAVFDQPVDAVRREVGELLARLVAEGAADAR